MSTLELLLYDCLDLTRNNDTIFWNRHHGIIRDHSAHRTHEFRSHHPSIKIWSHFLLQKVYFVGEQPQNDGGFNQNFKAVGTHSVDVFNMASPLDVIYVEVVPRRTPKKTARQG